MEKPRSGAPRRPRSAMPSNASLRSSSRSPSRWNSVVMAKLFVRLTAWRTSRMDRPARVKESTSTIASSPRYSAAQPRVEVQRQTVAPHPHHRRSPSHLVAPGQEAPQRARERGRVSDRITRRQPDAADAAIGECGPVVGGEHVTLVRSQRERIERVAVGPIGEREHRRVRLVDVVSRPRGGERDDEQHPDGEEPEQRERDREDACRAVELQRAARAAEAARDLDQCPARLERHP